MSLSGRDSLRATEPNSAADTGTGVSCAHASPSRLMNSCRAPAARSTGAEEMISVQPVDVAVVGGFRNDQTVLDEPVVGIRNPLARPSSTQLVDAAGTQTAFGHGQYLQRNGIHAGYERTHPPVLSRDDPRWQHKLDELGRLHQLVR